VIDSTVKLVKNQIMLAGIGLERDIPGDVPAIRGNLRNLQHVFLNLLLNAIQAMPGGGSIGVAASQESPDYIRVDVKDTGIGIKPEDLERIFDPFFTTKGVGRGTGLGLSVTYSIVKAHGGYIEVGSELNVGTTFSVFLPVEGSQLLGDS
jgi:signal transduction histidine kinase